MDLKHERDQALKKARQYAAGGNAVRARLFIDRAGQFCMVTPRRTANVERLLRQSRQRR